MKRKLYLMRHGETILNTQHRIQGLCDSPLTERGIKQAQNAKQYFRKKNIYFDHAYCSTSRRTEETLKLIVDGSYECVHELREMHYGSLEGKPQLKLAPKQCETYYLDYGGESSNDVKERMVQALTMIMSKEAHQSVLVVGHGAASFNFLIAFMDPKEELEKGFGNWIVFVCEFNGKTFNLEKVIRQKEMEEEIWNT